MILYGFGKGGFTGFGALAMPVLALAISPVRGASIILPILVVQDIVGVVAYRRTWSGRRWCRAPVSASHRVICSPRVPAERFYRIIYLLMVAIGLKLLWDGSALFA